MRVTKYLIRLIMIVIIGGVGFIGFIFVVSEFTKKMIMLRTYSPSGHSRDTSLWIVEDANSTYIRSGKPDSDWLHRLVENPRVGVIREGKQSIYTAHVEPRFRDRVNMLMAEKYGWIDRVLEVVRKPEGSVPVRLEPVEH